MGRDLRDPRWITTKGVLFVILGLLASTAILMEAHSLKVAALLALTIWSFARAYYFAFCVIEQYVDPTYRYRGILSFLTYMVRRRTGSPPS